MNGSIYKIENKINGKIYIGQTIQNVERRWAQHKCKGKTRGRSAVNKAILKYGEESFEFSVIDEANSMDELNNKEIFYITETKCMAPNGYNLKEGGLNASFSQETIDKIRKANTGKKRTKEQNEANRQRGLGVKQSKETIDKRVDKMIGHKVSEETKEKIRQSLIGHEVSQKTRDKIRETLLARKSA